MTRHLEPRESRRRRRVAYLTFVVVVAIASVAVAVLLSRKETAPDTAGAVTALGLVNIGNLETEGSSKRKTSPRCSPVPKRNPAPSSWSTDHRRRFPEISGSI